MERAAGLAREDTSQAKLDKLDGLLKQTSTSAQDAALFAEMLSLPNDGRYHAVELTLRSSTGKERWKHLICKWRLWRAAVRC